MFFKKNPYQFDRIFHEARARKLHPYMNLRFGNLQKTDEYPDWEQVVLGNRVFLKLLPCSHLAITELLSGDHFIDLR